MRLQAMGYPNYVKGFNLAVHEHALEIPLHWKKPQIILVNSMSDLFHEEVPEDFIKRAFEVMCRAQWHIFQILTKRSQRLLELNNKLPWLPHIWMGVSVENQDFAFRADHLRKTQAKVKFLSLEPLLGPMNNLNLQGIDWVIVGGESGPSARPMKPAWVIDIRNQCQKAGIPFFFKQWGGINRKKNGRELEGKVWNELPNPAIPTTDLHLPFESD